RRRPAPWLGPLTLPRSVQGELVDELDKTRHLEIRHVVPAPRRYRLPRRRLVGNDEGHRHFPEALIRDTDDRSLTNVWIAQQDRLDLRWVGVEPPDNEHVFRPPGHPEIALLVDPSEVPGAQPALR